MAPSSTPPRRAWVLRVALILSLFGASCASGEPGSTSSGTTTVAAEAKSSDLLSLRFSGTTDAPLGYYEYLPPGYGDGEKRPLLIALHGLGANGDGSERELPKLVTAENGDNAGIVALIEDDRWPLDRPFVVLAPQHDSPEDINIGPCDWEAEVQAFIEYAVANYDVDPERVYLTGLSCGAYGAWMYIAEHGNSQIAAMIPIAGDPYLAWAKAECDLGGVPIWAFHGDADEVVSIFYPRVVMKDLGACPSPPRHEATLTVYPGVDHNSWTSTYDLTAGHDIYAWMLNHQRGD